MTVGDRAPGWSVHLEPGADPLRAVEGLGSGSLARAFAATAGARGDLPALTIGDRSLTHRELDERAARLGGWLRERGVRQGQRVLLVGRTSHELVAAYLGILRVGATAFSVDAGSTAAELWGLIESARPVAACCDAPAGASVASLPESLRPGLALGLEPDADGIAIASAIGDGEPIEPADEAAPAILAYTSGTTGRPKGVHRSTPPPNAVATLRLYGYRPGEDRHLCTGPLYHAAPLAFSLNAPLSAGVGVVLMDGWDAEEALRLVEEHRITHTHMVPTMFHRLLSLPEDVRRGRDLSTLRFVLHGAAPCPVSVKTRLIEWLGPIVWEYYAGSENVGSTMIGPDEWLAHPGSVGQPRMTTVHICDDEHNELPIGEVGNIWFETPGASFEYHGDPEKTAKSRSPEGWFNLGDVGYLDGDGYLYLTDRQSFTIISGGVNIYPQETEDVLLLHPAVADAAVFGVPDDDLGEEVKGVVQLLDHAQAGPEMEAELLAFCRERLAAFKCPRSIDFDPALPRQDTGKLYKRLLKDRYWGDRTSRIV